MAVGPAGADCPGRHACRRRRLVSAGCGGKDGALNRYWLFRYTDRTTGKDRQLGIGSFDTVSLAGARAAARECREQLLKSLDPIEQRHAQRASNALADAQAMTFNQCCDAYLASHRAAWKHPKHAKQWENSLATYARPAIGALLVRVIDTALVIGLLEAHWQTKPETMSRVRGRIESILDWARVRGYRDGDNPARWKGHLDHLLPAKTKVHQVEHFAALPYVELPAFMAELRAVDGFSARALEFLILTASRTTMVLGARWDEVDLVAGVWTLPGSRMKGGKEHRVPLSPRAREIVAVMHKQRRGELVFPGRRGQPMHRDALRDVLMRVGRAVTPHGFRSSFKDWATEQTNFQTEAIEIALAHAVGDRVEAAYRRGDLFERRRRLMDAWSAYCGKPRASGAVTPLRRAVPA